MPLKVTIQKERLEVELKINQEVVLIKLENLKRKRNFAKKREKEKRKNKYYIN